MDTILLKWVHQTVDEQDLAIALEMSGGSSIGEILLKTKYETILSIPDHVTQVYTYNPYLGP